MKNSLTLIILLPLFLISLPGALPGQTNYPTWTTIGHANYPRAEGSMISHKGKFYLFNGFTTDVAYLNENERYDPVTNTWTKLASIPLNPDGSYKGNTHTGITVVGDDIWLLGGRSGNYTYEVAEEVWVYNTVLDTWRLGPELPIKRGGGGLVRLGRQVHYVGGFDYRSACDVDDHWVYDLDNPAAGWQDYSGTSPMPLARNHFGAATLGGKLYAVAGQHGHDACERGKNLTYVHRYDPHTDSWERLPDFPFVNSHIEPSTFAYNGKIYVLGGQGQESRKVCEYDPATNAWRILTDMELPIRLIAPGARVHDGNLIVMTGGEVAVNQARSHTRIKTFAPNQTVRLGFHPATLAVSGKERSTTEVILANYSAEDEVNYQIDNSNLPKWLSIDRNTGVARESFAEVEVTVDPRGLPSGTYQYSLRATAPGYPAASLPISFTVGQPAPSTDRYVAYREVECAAVGSNWVVGQASGASNGSYVTIKPGLNSTSGPPADASANRITFTFNLPRNDQYQLFARVSADNTADDSFYYRVNGGSWVTWGSGLVTGNGTYDWRRAPVTAFTLPAGTATIDFAYREDGLKLDKILLTSLSQAPTGIGGSDPTCGAAPDPDPPSEPTPTTFTQYREVECATVGSNWIVQQASGASNGSFATIKSGMNSTGAPPADLAANQIRFQFDLPQADKFNFFARVSADNTSDDSFYYRFNGGSWVRWWTGLVTGNGTYDWRQAPVTDFSLPAGTVTLDIAYREDGLKLDKVMLSSTVTTAPSGLGDTDGTCGSPPPPPADPPATSAEYWGEAECALQGGRWTVQSETTASNGKYVAWEGDSQFSVPGASPSTDHLSFQVSLPDAGTYYLFTRLNAIDNARNSLWVRVDNGSWIKFWKDEDGSNMLTQGFAWRRVNDDTRPVSFPLTAGNHTITIANREAGTQLDKVYLSTSSTLPTGSGSAATNCSQTLGNQAYATPLASEGVTPTAENSLEVYPNPASDLLTFHLEGAGSGRVDVLVTDLTGRIVLRRAFDKADEVLQETLPVSDLPAGVYQLHLINGKERLTRPFVKAR
ncbi:Kelch repeat-containing protein [Neolewinella litorea]|uniref:T9SS type A sorting domain-containing protein n=1 Tax=Neolewinella litorea TaxID=2562452 RepID=A0A4S4NPE9_9BACT|nr:kelch repeat-containing protein [Neolewinella litorea]THH41782.1 T9SS type A sorting domain-containing protein [Neolewinella litorea]